MKPAMCKIPPLLTSFAFICAISLPAAQANALQLTPVQVGTGVYAFIGDTGLRTYENEAMNANTGFIVTKGGATQK